MDMTVVVTRNAPERYRGFLASCMLEIAPGVYTSPRMSDGVRERVWEVCLEWSGALPYTLLIDPAGEVLYRKEGSMDALELKRTIVKSLNARKPW